jgi:MYXO-CTERM domain-containing protein
MVSNKMVAAAAAALGTGAVASADVLVVSQTFYNSSASTRSYEYYQYLPSASSGTSNLMSGSVTATLTDLNGNGATLGRAGNSSIYSATVNGATMQTLWDAAGSYQFSGFSVGQFLSGSAVPQSFNNLPGIIQDGSNLGIVLRFTLSAGDAVSIAATFTTTATPAPGAAAAVLVGGAFGLRRRRG